MKKLIPTILSLMLTIPTDAQNRLTGQSFASRSEIIAQNGMAATSQPLATQVAIEVLKKGGNAVDAAIAANATLAVVEPMSNGIGGDLFAIVWDAKTQRLYGLNASGRSPYELTREALISMGLDKIPLFGPLAISVPGCVDGWFELHNRFGNLAMAEILQPAIEYANAGYPVSEQIALYWNLAVEYIIDQPGFADVFMPGGQAPVKGEIFKNPGLAKTLSHIAENGRDGFYKGMLSVKMADYIKQVGGYLGVRDFEDHRSEWVDPVSTNYRGYDVWELPPNGQGIAALQMLNILENYDIGSLGFGSSEYLHLLIEAKKLAYEDRARFYADPDFNEIPVDYLISKEYAREKLKLIDLSSAALQYPSGDLVTDEIESGNTIYLTVADKDGNMVSLIQSTYWEFGSGVTHPELGFAFQNRGEMFKLESGHFNTYEPHKRPFHTIIPAFVTNNGKPFLSFGVMGGAMQPQGHVQVLANLIDFKMNLQEAGDAPRIRHMGSSSPTGSAMSDGGQVIFESGFDHRTIGKLFDMGHPMSQAAGAFGGYQAILYDAANKVYYGASEYRKDGQAAGY